VWGWSLAASLVWGAAVSGAAALVVGVPTLRLHGLYFAIATLAFAEMVRILFELFRYQVAIDGELVGPDGTDGFRNIRYIFDHDIDAVEFLLLIYALLAAAWRGSCCWRSRRSSPSDDRPGRTLAGCRIRRAPQCSPPSPGACGSAAGSRDDLCGAARFDVMLGVLTSPTAIEAGHRSVAARRLIDIGLLESIGRWRYRMIIFGDLVAVIVRARPARAEAAVAPDRWLAAKPAGGPPWVGKVAMAAVALLRFAAERDAGPPRPMSAAGRGPKSCTMTASSSSPIHAPASRCPASR
jgi:branched-chain amino acid transport system permease protein